MGTKTTFLKVATLALVATTSRLAYAQGGGAGFINAQSTIDLMNAANMRITNDMDIVTQRCENQIERKKSLQQEQSKRSTVAAGLTVQLNGLKAELDGRTKALTAAQNTLSGIDAVITTLKAKIANFASPSQQEKAFLAQIAENQAKKLKAQKDIAAEDKQFTQWKNTGTNETVLLKALLVSLNGGTLSATQKETLLVLSNYDKAINDLTKIVSDSDAAINAAMTALTRLETADQADNAAFVKTLNDQIAARPAARAAVVTAQTKVTETTGTIRAVEAQISVFSNIIIPMIHPVCAKLAS